MTQLRSFFPTISPHALPNSNPEFRCSGAIVGLHDTCVYGNLEAIISFNETADCTWATYFDIYGMNLKARSVLLRVALPRGP